MYTVTIGLKIQYIITPKGLMIYSAIARCRLRQTGRAYKSV